MFWVWAAPVLKYQSSQIMGNNEGGQQSTHWQASYLVSVAVTSVRGHVLVSKAQEGPLVVPVIVSHAVLWVCCDQQSVCLPSMLILPHRRSYFFYINLL